MADNGQDVDTMSDVQVIMLFMEGVSSAEIMAMDRAARQDLARQCRVALRTGKVNPGLSSAAA